MRKKITKQQILPQRPKRYELTRSKDYALKLLGTYIVPTADWRTTFKH